MKPVDARGALDIVRRTIDATVALHRRVLEGDVAPVARNTTSPCGLNGGSAES